MSDLVDQQALEQRKFHSSHSNFWQGLIYFVAAITVASLGSSPLLGRGVARLSEVAKDRPISATPLSKALNLEGRMAENADNVVRLASPYGIGTGILTDPLTIETANHVIAPAFQNKAPIYVQSPSYLGEGESIKVDLTAGNVRYNKNTDRAQITLDHPIYRAHTLTVNGNYNFGNNPNIYGVCYRNKEVVTLRGEVIHRLTTGLETASGPIRGTVYATTAQGGPGNSGCGIFNGNDELVGIVLAVPNDKRFLTTLDTSNIIFGDIGNQN